MKFKKLMILTIFLIFAGHVFGAQKSIHRFALVIGNEAYKSSPWRPLKSPAKDALDIKAMLLTAGFQDSEVTLVVDGDGRKLRTEVDAFGISIRKTRADILQRNAQASEAMVVIVFYSGHGFMVDEVAFLAGINASGKYLEDLIEQSVPLNQLVRDLTPYDRDVDFLSVLLIDACRTDVRMPSRAGDASKSAAMSVTDPFARIRGVGRITVLATTDGHPSFDGRSSSENSVFTAAIREAASVPSSPQSFSEFVNRIEINTPKIAKARFNVDQSTEIRKVGINSEFFWTSTAGSDAAAKAADLNSKGISTQSTGWIWIGDYGGNTDSSEKLWINPRFEEPLLTTLPAPAELRLGSELVIQANLNVRKEFPKKDNRCIGKKYQECAVLMGVIPKGLKVVVIDSAKFVGQQTWVKVKFDQSALY